MTEETPRKFNQEQYDFLMKCLKKRNFGEWSEWYRAYLQECPQGAHLEGANLQNAHLEGADLHDAHLERANLQNAHLEGAELRDVDMKDADFTFASVNGETIITIRSTDITTMGRMILHLFRNTEAGKMIVQLLRNAKAGKMVLQVFHNTEAYKMISRLFDKDLSINDGTNFTGVGLDSLRIDPKLKTQLEKNIRKIQWKEWYRDNWLKQLFLRPFWWLSDYGTTTSRIIIAVFISNTVFGLIYYWLEQSGVENIFNMTNTTLETAIIQSNMIVFSVTDMATRDMDAGPMFLVMCHIVIGYFLLAALVTRLGIMYQSLSP
jgi:uncharacterized protein YjbI with pentapeptide repeats